MKRKKICDICGMPFERGLTLRALHSGIAPWQKRVYVCDKCESVMKMMILSYRRKPSR